MQKANAGNTVSVHYHGTLADGSIFDSSKGREPLVFVVGSGQVIKGFDEAVIEMTPGEVKTVTILAGDAYGLHNEEMIFDFPISDFPGEIHPAVGLELQMNDEDGNIFPVVITEVLDDVVILDANHPLAGKDLTFEIELVSVS
jgi:peptidylprolyl isomerase